MKAGLKDTAFNQVNFTTKDIVEGIERPSFFIDFESNTTGLLNTFTKERTLEIKIYYFSKDKLKPKLELMELQEHLESIFLKYIKVNEDFYIHVNKVHFNVNRVDGFLIMDIETYSIERVVDDSKGDSISELNMNTNLRGN